MKKKLRKYVVTFDLNVIDFSCITWAESKNKAIKDVLWNINLRQLKKLNRIRCERLDKVKGKVK